MDDLATVAARAGDDLEGASPREVLGWALEQWHPKLAIASSMGDGVLAHLASTIRPGVPVLFLDTGYHFAETIGTRDAVAAVYDVEVVTLRAKLTVEEQDAAYGPRLHDRDPDACCRMRKVEPLAEALAGYVAWASGGRREETASRANLKPVEWDAKRGMAKVSPLYAWTQADVDAYVEEHGILVNPLAYDGYPSIGCAPCTHRVAPGEDPRSGRWAGTGKTECGLHV